MLSFSKNDQVLCVALKFKVMFYDLTKPEQPAAFREYFYPKIYGNFFSFNVKRAVCKS